MPESISKSGLWKILQDYYRSLGVAAWDDRTPYYVTNSQVIAEAYADLIIAQWLDHPPDPSQLCYLFELGSGTGRFAYQLARELKRKLSYFPVLQKVRFQLVLSDIVETNLDFWAQHQRLLELGDLVDFALIEPGAEDRVSLRKSGLVLNALVNPLMVLANYFFDSLPHDEFALAGGKLEECLLELVPKAERHHSSPDRLDIRDLDMVRSYRTVQADSYYQNARHRAVLRFYRNTVGRGSVTVPVGALDCLDRLRGLGKLILISSDRGFTEPEEMSVYPAHPPALHDGCFSHMVNYHALGFGFCTRLATRRHLLDGVQTVFFSELPQGAHLTYAFRERLERANAVNHANELFALYRDQPPFKGLLSFVRLNLNDPNALSAVAKKISENLAGLNYGEHHELVSLLEKVWENDFHFRGAPNVTFWLAHLYTLLGRHDRAIRFYDLTMERQGEDEMLLYLQGTCWQALGERQKARKLYEKALERCPEMPEASRALRELVAT